MKFACTNCEREHYVNPKACIGAILFIDKHRVVLARRARDPHKGMLDCLGGFVDVGENFEQAFYRELQEEAGLTPDDIIDVMYTGSAYDLYPWQGEDIPLVSVFFSARLKPGVTLNPDDDVDELVIYKLKDLPLEEIAFASVQQIYSDL